MTQSRALANQEREFQVRRLGKLGRALLMTVASVLSFLTLALLAADQLFHPDAFVIKELKIKGKFRYLQPAEVDLVLREQDLGNFFSVELDRLKAKVEDIEWVQSADVRRQWPNSLTVSIVEHQPAMRWGDDKWVSTSGSIIALPTNIADADVITLNGDEAQSKRILLQAARWQKHFARDGIELRKAKLSNSQAWTLGLYYPELDSEFDLLLGSKDVAARIARFKVLFNEQLKFSERTLKRVDARYPDGLAVKHGEARKMNQNDSDTNLALFKMRGSLSSGLPTHI
jgi:cell division protein FtsQ